MNENDNNKHSNAISGSPSMQSKGVISPNSRKSAGDREDKDDESKLKEQLAKNPKLAQSAGKAAASGAKSALANVVGGNWLSSLISTVGNWVSSLAATIGSKVATVASLAVGLIAAVVGFFGALVGATASTVPVIDTPVETEYSLVGAAAIRNVHNMNVVYKEDPETGKSYFHYSTKPSADGADSIGRLQREMARRIWSALGGFKVIDDPGGRTEIGSDGRPIDDEFSRNRTDPVDPLSEGELRNGTPAGDIDSSGVMTGRDSLVNDVTQTKKSSISAVGDDNTVRRKVCAGLRPEQLCAVLGNWMHESSLDPTAVETIFDEAFYIGAQKQYASMYEFMTKYRNPNTAQIERETGIWFQNKPGTTTVAGYSSESKLPFRCGIGLGQWTDSTPKPNTAKFDISQYPKVGRNTLLITYAKLYGRAYYLNYQDKSKGWNGESWVTGNTNTEGYWYDPRIQLAFTLDTSDVGDSQADWLVNIWAPTGVTNEIFGDAKDIWNGDVIITLGRAIADKKLEGWYSNDSFSPSEGWLPEGGSGKIGFELVTGDHPRLRGTTLDGSFRLLPVGTKTANGDFAFQGDPLYLDPDYKSPDPERDPSPDDEFRLGNFWENEDHDPNDTSSLNPYVGTDPVTGRDVLSDTYRDYVLMDSDGTNGYDAYYTNKEDKYTKMFDYDEWTIDRAMNAVTEPGNSSDDVWGYPEKTVGLTEIQNMDNVDCDGSLDIRGGAVDRKHLVGRELATKYAELSADLAWHGRENDEEGNLGLYTSGEWKPTANEHSTRLYEAANRIDFLQDNDPVKYFYMNKDYFQEAYTDYVTGANGNTVPVTMYRKLVDPCEYANEMAKKQYANCFMYYYRYHLYRYTTMYYTAEFMQKWEGSTNNLESRIKYALQFFQMWWETAAANGAEPNITAKWAESPRMRMYGGAGSLNVPFNDYFFKIEQGYAQGIQLGIQRTQDALLKSEKGYKLYEFNNNLRNSKHMDYYACQDIADSACRIADVSIALSRSQGTNYYKEGHDFVFDNTHRLGTGGAGDNIYKSCDRTACTAIRLSGCDDNFPGGNTLVQIEYLTSSPRWTEVDWGGDPNNLCPGDVLIRKDSLMPGANYEEAGDAHHIMIYVGGATLQRHWYHNEASRQGLNYSNELVVHGSFGERYPAMGKLGENHKSFHAYRCTSPMAPGKSRYIGFSPIADVGVSTY